MAVESQSLCGVRWGLPIRDRLSHKACHRRTPTAATPRRPPRRILYASGIDGTRVVLPGLLPSVTGPPHERVRDVVRWPLRHHLHHRLRSLEPPQRDPASVADAVPATGTGERPDPGRSCLRRTRSMELQLWQGRTSDRELRSVRRSSVVETSRRRSDTHHAARRQRRRSTTRSRASANGSRCRPISLLRRTALVRSRDMSGRPEGASRSPIRVARLTPTRSQAVRRCWR